jgi:Asp-tRNA(Asn)/Glu-tRNA(Gln) amidotransferase A subunit family amidase
MSATQLAALIRGRKVSVREVIETHLRIDAVNPALNAIVIRLDEQALVAIPVGRTNLATFTVRWHCESELRGHTINPWDATRTPAHPAAAMQASSGETRTRPGVTG